MLRAAFRRYLTLPGCRYRRVSHRVSAGASDRVSDDTAEKYGVSAKDKCLSIAQSQDRGVSRL